MRVTPRLDYEHPIGRSFNDGFHRFGWDKGDREEL